MRFGLKLRSGPRWMRKQTRTPGSRNGLGGSGSLQTGPGPQVQSSLTECAPCPLQSSRLGCEVQTNLGWMRAMSARTSPMNVRQVQSSLRRRQALRVMSIRVWRSARFLSNFSLGGSRRLDFTCGDQLTGPTPAENSRLTGLAPTCQRADRAANSMAGFPVEFLARGQCELPDAARQVIQCVMCVMSTHIDDGLHGQPKDDQGDLVYPDPEGSRSHGHSPLQRSIPLAPT